MNHQNIAIIGSSGAIGSALVAEMLKKKSLEKIFAFSQSGKNKLSLVDDRISYHSISYQDEDSIKVAAELATKNQPLDAVLVASGILHQQDLMPEKSLRDLSFDKFHTVFAANTFFPALVMKHFLPKLRLQSDSLFAAISARVGSISDNRLGGWYAYRASKSALNMVIKNASIEMARKNKQAVIVGLHPGTVNSHLSQPFQSSVTANKLFTPDFSAQKLIEVLEGLNSNHSGKCFAWDGLEIPS